MLPELEEIPKRRKLLALTQSQLAKLAGVSQSLIAKIESNRIEPLYETAKKIFKALENEKRNGKTVVKAKDVHNTKVISINKNNTITGASQIMHKHGYSQLPVSDDHKKIVGSISEHTINDYLAKGHDIKSLSKMQISGIMDSAFPLVNENYPVELIASVLGYAHAVLTTRRGRVVGIITKSDLLKLIRS